jgi:hypothetical protein
VPRRVECYDSCGSTAHWKTSRSVSLDCLVDLNTPVLCTSLVLPMMGDVFLMNPDTPEDLARVRALGDRRPAGAGRAPWGPAPDGDKAGA